MPFLLAASIIVVPSETRFLPFTVKLTILRPPPITMQTAWTQLLHSICENPKTSAKQLLRVSDQGCQSETFVNADLIFISYGNINLFTLVSSPLPPRYLSMEAAACFQAVSVNNCVWPSHNIAACKDAFIESFCYRIGGKFPGLHRFRQTQGKSAY